MLRRRSAILIDRMVDHFDLPGSGALLDVGCGAGVTLRAIAAQRPGWLLDGFELGDANLGRLRTLPGFRQLHTGAINGIATQYDLVTMIHSLEHFTDPEAVLRDICARLRLGGRLVVEVCNVEENPFDILIADHLMHFSPRTLGALLGRAGFGPFSIYVDWVAREISAVAGVSPAAFPSTQPAVEYSPRGWAHLGDTLKWLGYFVETARSAAVQNPHFGIFGTSISGTWLASQLVDAPAFFIDEDPSRIGKVHLERPILSPKDVPPNATVYLALTPALAREVHARFVDHPAIWLLPPAEPF